MVEKIERRGDSMQDISARQYVNQIMKKGKEEIRIAFFGGSLSKGEMVKKEQCFVSLFEQKLPQILGKKKKSTILRYGESGTMSSNGLFKVRELLDEKPDLVFLDYAMNDTGDRFLWETTEGICYQLLEAGIGVIILLFCNEQGQCTRGAMERVAGHYHVPVYDIGRTIFSRIEAGTLTWQEYGQDYVHPTVYGNELITAELLKLWEPMNLPDMNGYSLELPKEPAFEGAFRKTRQIDLTEKLRGRKAGEILYQDEVEGRMFLMEFWQDSKPNRASLTIIMDGKMVATAEAYASMAWGNRVCRYIGGGGDLEKHQLTVTLGKSAPPEDWDYSRFQLRILLGV